MNLIIISIINFGIFLPFRKTHVFVFVEKIDFLLLCILVYSIYIVLAVSLSFGRSTVGFRGCMNYPLLLLHNSFSAMNFQCLE